MTNITKEIIEEDLQKLAISSSGNQYWRVDLHTHTPASKGDHQWKDRITSNDIVAAYAKKGISLIAVTDHSTGAWVDDMKKAGKKYAERHETQFCVLPGVELNVGGVHVQAIFPDNVTTKGIALFLGKLDLVDDDFGKEGTLVDKTLSEVASIVHQKGGILIGSHCNSKNGVVDGLKGKTRQNAIEAIDFLEINANQGRERVEKTASYVHNNLGYKNKPIVYSSDSHGPDDLVSNVTFIKMDSPCFEGLRQLIHEPYLRSPGRDIRIEKVNRVLGIVVDGGIYQRAAVSFNEDLNVIIGGRGAGKSALIDLLHFTLGIQSVTTEFQEYVNQRLVEFLKEGDEVRVYIEVGDAKYCVQRRMESVIFRDSVELLLEPEIYQIRDVGPLRESINSHIPLPVDLYGQGEVLELTKRVDDQLSLIDSFTNLDEIVVDINNQLVNLEENSDTFYELFEKKIDLDESISNKKAIMDRIKELDDHLKEPVFKEHEAWETSKSHITDLETIIDNLENDIPEKPYYNYNVPDLPEKVKEQETLKKITKECETLIAKLNKLAEKEVKTFNVDSQKIQTQLDAWWDVYESARLVMEDQLKELGLQEVKHAYEERNKLRDQLKEIERDYEPALNKINIELEVVNTERAKILTKLEQLVNARSTLREQTAKSLNKKLPNNIKIEIQSLGNDKPYFNLLDQEIYYRKRIRNKGRHIQTLISEYQPKALAFIIRSQDKDKLIDIGLTESAAKIVIDISENEIRKIEEVILEDQPMILLRREGEDEFVQLDKLSLGEKCSAILSILLVSEDRPLIIDEPEAELDHDFICNNVVESIRDVKGRRQIIVCTHNPNIPVLGDAELVIKVSKVTGKPQCSIVHTGGFEHPDSIYFLKQLEGGEDALRRRSVKYQMS